MISHKMTRATAILLAAWIFAHGSAALAGAASETNASQPSPITVTLVSEVTAIEPGSTFSVGILQTMAPGYHTYWKNPGTVGMSTRVEWDLPDGFAAGDIQWPIPSVTNMSGYRVWGYERKALLVVNLNAPKTLKPGDVIEIKGATAWMCCGAQCHPGNKVLALRLPVVKARSVDEKLAPDFDTVRRQQPKQTDAWRVTCRKAGGTFVLTVVPVGEVMKRDPGSVQFFGYDRLISSDKPQRVQRVGRQYVIRMPEEAYTNAGGDRMRGILVASRNWAVGPDSRVMSVDVPITQAPENLEEQQPDTGND